MAYAGQRSFETDSGSVGDCPNPSCPHGRIEWRRWSGPADIPALFAGTCRKCGTWAAQCPVCGDRVTLCEHTVECSCETCLVLTRAGSFPHVDVITADDARRTYAPPGE